MSVVNYYKYTTPEDEKKYIIKEEVVENGIKKYSKAEVIGEFGNKKFIEEKNQDENQDENQEIIEFVKEFILSYFPPILLFLESIILV